MQEGKKTLGLLLTGMTGISLVFGSVAIAADKVVVIPIKYRAGGSVSCTGADEVESAGYCWKDRNLGASALVTNPMDEHADGDLYQWGRSGDGHQNRYSDTIDEVSNYDVPGHSKFIAPSTLPADWRGIRNDNLWQGLGGVNNPCPQGFRVPTLAELEDEVATWTSENAAGAFASPLRLPPAGSRAMSGTVINAGTTGAYWSSTVTQDHSMFLEFGNTYAQTNSIGRVNGMSVRCIKD